MISTNMTLRNGIMFKFKRTISNARKAISKFEFRFAREIANHKGPVSKFAIVISKFDINISKFEIDISAMEMTHRKIGDVLFRQRDLE